MEIVKIPVAEIDASERLRPVDQDYVALLAESFQREGMRMPIEVKHMKHDGYRLIAGAHRLMAAKALGWESINAIVLKVADAKVAILEVEENLLRHDLNELDRAAFLARWKELYEAENPEVKQGGDRKSDQTAKFVHLIESFSAAASDKMKISERSVRRAVTRFEGIAPDVRKEIAGTRIALIGSELDALARMPTADQRAAVKLLLGDDPPKNVAAAYKQARGIVPAPVDERMKQFDDLMKAWKRAGKKARGDFVAYQDSTGALDGVKGGAK